jgi:hypothetical protein
LEKLPPLEGGGVGDARVRARKWGEWGAGCAGRVGGRGVAGLLRLLLLLRRRLCCGVCGAAEGRRGGGA